MKMTDIVNGAIGAFPDNCAGYLNPGATGLGYIATLTLSVGKVKADMDIGLEGIVSYDRCEADDAYIGQINMLTASSFCGMNGAVWGYDLARADDLTETRLSTLRRHDGIDIPVYSAQPLLDAAYRLFGSQSQRRFNLLPGAMVVCANKSWTTLAPPGKTTTVWCAIALAIAEDRGKDANLFIEDASDTATTGPRSLDDLVQNIAKSILRCGADQGVLYKEVFVGHKSIEVDEGTIGCALTCAPYVTLPKSAIPHGKPASTLLDLTISEWEKEMKLVPLPPYTDYPG
jgi:histidine decarboxylase